MNRDRLELGEPGTGRSTFFLPDLGLSLDTASEHFVLYSLGISNKWRLEIDKSFAYSGNAAHEAISHTRPTFTQVYGCTHSIGLYTYRPAPITPRLSSVYDFAHVYYQ